MFVHRRAWYHTVVSTGKARTCAAVYFALKGGAFADGPTDARTTIRRKSWQYCR